ncbi:creatininase family protein, partial [Nocardiopsis protaetiae]
MSARPEPSEPRLYLAEMTTVEAERAVTDSPLVLLPAGAFEQHGPGLPLATDLVRAERVAERVAARLGGRAVIGPALPVGVSPHHLAFAGTLSLGVDTFRTVVHEYVEGLYRHGWRKVLVVTGHGGNNAALTTVAQDLLARRPDLEFAWTPLTALAADAVAAMDVREVSGHSGEAETAQMLHLAPGLVRTGLLEAGTTALAELDDLSRLARRRGHPTL